MKKKKQNRAPVFLVIMIVLVLMVVLSTTVFFNIETVKITGSSKYSYEDILNASGVIAGDNLFRTNLKKVSQKIEKQLVYVGHAEVSRANATTLAIEITPAKPVANFITDGGNVFLISGEEKILDSFEEPRAGLYNFYGTNPKPGLLPGTYYTSEDKKKDETVKAIIDFLEKNISEDPEKSAGNENDELFDQLIDGITAINVTERTAIIIIYDDRVNIEIGNVNDIDYKFRFAAKTLFDGCPDDFVGTLTWHDDGSYSVREQSNIERSEEQYRENLEAYNATLTTAPEDEDDEEGGKKKKKKKSDDSEDDDEDSEEEDGTPEMRE